MTEKANGSAKPKKDPVLSAHNVMYPRGHFRVDHDAIAPAGTTPEMLTSTAFWVNVRAMLKPFDIVHVVTEDEQWWAEVLVRANEKGGAFQPWVLRFEKLPPRLEGDRLSIPDGFRIDYDPTRNEYTPIRIKDRVPMSGPLRTWHQARDAIENHPALRGK